MSKHLSHEEVRQAYLNTMGDSLGSIFLGLCVEVTSLYIKWDEYVQMFGTNPERVALLNRSASKSFRVIQDSLWESILLHIARLTDPAKSFGKDNLSLQRLASLVHADQKEIVKKQIATALERSDFCRDWRNRHIAHRDLNLAISGQAEPLLLASRTLVKEALESLAQILNTVSVRYGNPTIRFDLIYEPYGAADLLCILDKGVNAGINTKTTPVLPDSPPVLRFQNPRTGIIIYPDMEKDGKGGWQMADPTLVDGMDLGRSDKKPEYPK